MTIMWVNLSIAYLFSFLARYYSTFDIEQYKGYKPNKLYIFFLIATLVIVSGLRSNIGDTYAYKHSYSINKYTWEAIDYSGDFGFNIIQLLLQKISSDPQLLIFSTALITNILIIITLIKYSKMIELAIFVYITSGMFTTSMNGIRQYLAAAFVFIGTNYIVKGDFKKYFLLILLASTIHKSALVLIPIYFIARREAWTKVTIILLAFSVFIVLGFNMFSELLFTAIDDTQYGHYSTFTEGGASKIRILVNLVPILIAFLGREKLKRLWPQSDYIVNMSIISLVFIVIASQNWIFARFNIYFGLYNLILISWIVKLFKHNNQRLIYYGILVCYFAYFYYEHIISFGLVYKSDYINFN